MPPLTTLLFFRRRGRRRRRRQAARRSIRRTAIERTIGPNLQNRIAREDGLLDVIAVHDNHGVLFQRGWRRRRRRGRLRSFLRQRHRQGGVLGQGRQRRNRRRTHHGNRLLFLFVGPSVARRLAEVVPPGAGQTNNLVVIGCSQRQPQLAQGRCQR